VDGRLVLDDLGRELIGLGPGLRDLIGSSQRALEPCALLRELRLLLAQGIGGRLLRLPRGVVGERSRRDTEPDFTRLS